LSEPAISWSGRRSIGSGPRSSRTTVGSFNALSMARRAGPTGARRTRPAPTPSSRTWRRSWQASLSTLRAMRWRKERWPIWRSGSRFDRWISGAGRCARTGRLHCEDRPDDRGYSQPLQGRHRLTEYRYGEQDAEHRLEIADHGGANRTEERN